MPWGRAHGPTDRGWSSFWTGGDSPCKVRRVVGRVDETGRSVPAGDPSGQTQEEEVPIGRTDTVGSSTSCPGEGPSTAEEAGEPRDETVTDDTG